MDRLTQLVDAYAAAVAARRIFERSGKTDYLMHLRTSNVVAVCRHALLDYIESEVVRELESKGKAL